MQNHISELELKVSKLTRELGDKCVRLSSKEKSNSNKHEKNDRLKLLPSPLEETTYDGTMIWKIPDFNQRMRDAVANPLHSLPFYTCRYGYKMCVRACLNGDGMGHGTHLSVFFVLMKGEYDNILEWPFRHKVTMILINQNDSPSIVDIFKPTSDSSSFQKPTFDMNIASGFPRFAKQDLLGPSDGFVVGDTIFIGCIVDTTRVSQ